MRSLTTSVVIVGAGPVGLLLAHFLGRAGVQTVVLEREAALSDEPRAVGIDPESLRSLQSLDLLDALDGDILFGLVGDYINGNGDLLFEFMDASPGPLGYPSMNGFSQPALVRTLAAELCRYDCVQLRFEHELTELHQDNARVRATVRDGAETLTIHAEYLVGCDGGRSKVRSLLGIRMQGESNPMPWLVIDTREREDDGEARYRFFCDPKRPGMFIQTPHSNRRWEWMLLPGEDRNAFLEDETIFGLLKDHVDVGKVDIYRRRVYDFHAIIADRFQDGRVFLAGDAAHMTPPFAGQGLNSGLRDAANLGWKLAMVVKDGAPASLLETYQTERWSHARQLIDLAVKLGDEIQPIDPEKAAQRDAAFKTLNESPEDMRAFQRGVFSVLADRFFETGAAVDIQTDAMSGRMLLQPRVAGPDGHRQPLDDHLGNGVSIVGYGCDPARAIACNALQPWLRAGTSVVPVADTADGIGVREDGRYFAKHLGAGAPNMILVRPDRFCMAAFDENTAEDKLSRAARMLGLQGGL